MDCLIPSYRDELCLWNRKVSCFYHKLHQYLFRNFGPQRGHDEGYSVSDYFLAYFHRFRDDVEYMTGVRPGWYWLITWRYIGPVLAVLLFIAGLVDMGREGIGYWAYDKVKVGGQPLHILKMECFL